MLLSLLSVDWISSLAREIGVGVAVGAAFYYFGRKFPVPPAPELSPEDLATPVSGWWTALATALTIATGTGLCLAVVYFARSLNAQWALRDGPAAFLLVPTKFWWYLYGGFLGLLLGWPIAVSILRRTMDSKVWHVWMDKQNRKAGFDGNRAMRLLAYVILVPFTIFFLPSLGCHTAFSETGITTWSYWAMKEARHPYRDITRFAALRGGLDRSGKFYPDSHLIIDFRDGTRWTSRDGFRDPEPVNTELVKFLALHTGLQPIYADTDRGLK